jgi:hypothetical protein
MLQAHPGLFIKVIDELAALLMKRAAQALDLAQEL